MSNSPQITDVFNFMELRSPFQPEDSSLRRSYIYDDVIDNADNRDVTPSRQDVDLQTINSPSAIGRMVYESVFCTKDSGSSVENIDNLLKKMMALLTAYVPVCGKKSIGGHAHNSVGERAQVALPLVIQELERNAYLNIRNNYYLIPYRLETIIEPDLAQNVGSAYQNIVKAFADPNTSSLVKSLSKLFAVGSVREFVFEQGTYSTVFRQTKRKLFDALYIMYILRRRVHVNLEQVIDGLRVLHVLEALAIDEVFDAIKAGSLPAADGDLRKTLENIYPELAGWNGTDSLTQLPLIRTSADLKLYLNAAPVIHPIFARLHWYRVPFNNIKPIGIGDLKVVKQWLVKYLPGEISHIENVLKGEVRDRTHRRLEKTEDSYTTTTSINEHTQKDTQSTDRADLKREVENIVKSELNIGANFSVTYNGTPVKSTVSGNFSYKNDSTARDKSNSEYFREIISKAVQRVEKNVTESRSIFRKYETEETNKHVFENNQSGATNIVGIYRWLDKKYKAQLFNYGRRMMFEFMIPEPSAFFVESRLRHHESTVQLPQVPERPASKTASLSFTAAAITQQKFLELSHKYDLSEFHYPSASELEKVVDFIDTQSGSNYFKERDIGDDRWFAKTYVCNLKSKNYRLKQFFAAGSMYFWGAGDADSNNQQKVNTIRISVNGATVVHDQNDTRPEQWAWNPPNGFLLPYSILLEEDTVSLTIGCMDLMHYHLSFGAALEYDQNKLTDLKNSIFWKIVSLEQKKLDKEYQEELAVYNGKMTIYRDKLSELKALVVNDLLQGQSEAYNSEVISAELKKHCLTLLTKEFDADSSDDLVSRIDPVRDISNNFISRRFQVDENAGTCGFETHVEAITYPAIDIALAQRKNNHIQFLEQAFEWQQLAYVFYPYFWASQPKWIELLSRNDETDPNMTAFLRAGSCKVLLAITPAYESAVLHFLATREPWSGGPSPVIGDPLYIPLYEEIRKNQDDTRDAIPEGEPWTFTLPTSLVVLDDESVTLPTFPDVAPGN